MPYWLNSYDLWLGFKGEQNNSFSEIKTENRMKNKVFSSDIIMFLIELNIEFDTFITSFNMIK